MKTIELTPQQLLDCVEQGDFSTDLRLKTRTTVFLMSQAWCPQYTTVKRMIEGLEDIDELTIYETLYDRNPAGEAFMPFKEQKFGNHLIPYIRFYQNGTLIKESNYLSEGAFRQYIS